MIRDHAEYLSHQQLQMAHRPTWHLCCILQCILCIQFRKN